MESYTVNNAPSILDVPAELAAYPRWGCWRWEEARKKGNWKKVPVDPRTGKRAKTTDTATWATLTEATTALLEKSGYNGLGFVLTRDDPYTVIDLDKCRDPDTGKVEPWALEIVRRLDSLTLVTVNYIHVTLHKALRDAVSDGLIPRNVCDAVKSPRPGKNEVTPLSQDHARSLLAAARGDRLEALYTVALHCGLRQGELLGLKWEDVDLNTGKLSVRRTLSDTRDGFRFEQPKPGKGRSVKLSQKATEALRSHRKRQLEEQTGGVEERFKGLVFTTTNGTPYTCTNLLSQRFRPLLKRAGLPEATRFHDLRHTCATTLLKVGQHPKYVQELLGHASISITLDTYSHVIEGMGDGLADAMDDAL